MPKTRGPFLRRPLAVQANWSPKNSFCRAGRRVFQTLPRIAPRPSAPPATGKYSPGLRWVCLDYRVGAPPRDVRAITSAPRERDLLPRTENIPKDRMEPYRTTYLGMVLPTTKRVGHSSIVVDADSRKPTGTIVARFSEPSESRNSSETCTTQNVARFSALWGTTSVVGVRPRRTRLLAAH